MANEAADSATAAPMPSSLIEIALDTHYLQYLYLTNVLVRIDPLPARGYIPYIYIYSLLMRI